MQAAAIAVAATKAAETAHAAAAAAARPRGRVDFRFSRLHELGDPARAHAATSAAQARSALSYHCSQTYVTVDVGLARDYLVSRLSRVHELAQSQRASGHRRGFSM